MDEVHNLLNYIDENNEEMKDNVYKEILDRMKLLHDKIKTYEKTNEYELTFCITETKIIQNSYNNIDIFNDTKIVYNNFELTEEEYEYLYNLTSSIPNIEHFEYKNSKRLERIFDYLIALRQHNSFSLRCNENGDDECDCLELTDYTVFNKSKIVSIKKKNNMSTFSSYAENSG